MNIFERGRIKMLKLKEFTYKIETPNPDGTLFNPNVFISTNRDTSQENREVAIGELLDFKNNPYLSETAYFEKIMNPEITVEELKSILRLEFTLDAISEGKFNHQLSLLWYRPAFVKAVTAICADSPLGVTLNKKLNKAIYEVMIFMDNNVPNQYENFVELYDDLIYRINKDRIDTLTTHGFKLNDAYKLALSLSSSDSEAEVIIAFNSILLECNPDKVTPKMIKDAYKSLFNIETIFSPVMFNTINYNESTEDVKQMYMSISIALADFLESSQPSVIYRTLWVYSCKLASNPGYLNTVRFGLRNSSLGPNTAGIVQHLINNGAYII